MNAPLNHIAVSPQWSHPNLSLNQALAPPGTINLIPGPEMPLSSMAYVPPSHFQAPQPFWPHPGQVITDYMQQGGSSTSQSRPVIAGNGPSHGLIKSEGLHIPAMQPPMALLGQQQIVPKYSSRIEKETFKSNMQQSSKSPPVAKRKHSRSNPKRIVYN